MMRRLLLVALGLSLWSPTLLAETKPPRPAASPAAEPASAEPAKPVRRVERLQQLKITGKVRQPGIVFLVERQRAHFDVGTIRYTRARKSYERYE